jgi:hypothetical protein
MIDPLAETLISLADAAKSCPKRRGGKKTHVSCIYRWTTVGCRGVVLESIQIGGTRCTSHEALARFFARLTATPSEPTSVRTPAQRERAIARAEKELDEASM